MQELENVFYGINASTSQILLKQYYIYLAIELMLLSG